MNFKNLFGKGRSDDKYWADIKNACKSHVERLLVYFETNGAPLYEWAEPRFRQLIEPKCLDMVIKNARSMIEEKKNNVEPVQICAYGTWVVALSTMNTSIDSDFLKACPDHSFESLALLTREQFRTKRAWYNMDFAHWILLVDDNDARIHLHTIWDFIQQIARVENARKTAVGNTVTVINPPNIIPLDLLKRDYSYLSNSIWEEDMNWLKLNPPLSPK